MVLGWTVVLSIIVYIMLKGKSIVNLTAKGAGRISDEERTNTKEQEEDSKHASISYTYPMYNVTAISSL